jgi:hypothetical protein
MKSVLLTLATAATLTAAAPAFAEGQNYDDDYGQYAARQARAAQAIDRCLRARTIDADDARWLRDDLQLVQSLEERRRAGERTVLVGTLERRMDRLEDHIAFNCGALVAAAPPGRG